MPKASINRELALRAICIEIGENYEELEGDYERLNCIVRQERVNWHRAAANMGISRDKLYHWYRDTFTRENEPKMDISDKEEVEKTVQCRVEMELPLDNEFKESYFMSEYQGIYDYAVFSVVFNNARYKARRQHYVDGGSIESDSFDLLRELKCLYKPDCVDEFEGETIL